MASLLELTWLWRADKLGWPARTTTLGKATIDRARHTPQIKSPSGQTQKAHEIAYQCGAPTSQYRSSITLSHTLCSVYSSRHDPKAGLIHQRE